MEKKKYRKNKKPQDRFEQTQLNLSIKIEDNSNSYNPFAYLKQYLNT